MSRGEYLSVINSNSVTSIIKSLELIYSQKLSSENFTRVYEYISNEIIDARNLYDKDKYGNDLIRAVAMQIVDRLELI